MKKVVNALEKGEALRNDLNAVFMKFIVHFLYTLT